MQKTTFCFPYIIGYDGSLNARTDWSMRNETNEHLRGYTNLPRGAVCHQKRTMKVAGNTMPIDGTRKNNRRIIIQGALAVIRWGHTNFLWGKVQFVSSAPYPKNTELAADQYAVHQRKFWIGNSSRRMCISKHEMNWDKTQNTRQETRWHGENMNGENIDMFHGPKGPWTTKGKSPVFDYAIVGYFFWCFLYTTRYWDIISPFWQETAKYRQSLPLLLTWHLSLQYLRPQTIENPRWIDIFSNISVPFECNPEPFVSLVVITRKELYSYVVYGWRSIFDEDRRLVVLYIIHETAEL